MADQDRSRHQLEEAAAATAAEVGHRDGFLLQKGGCGHAAILALRAWRSNRQKHVEQGLAGASVRALDRKQPALGTRAAVRGNLVGVAVRFENAMARDDDQE